jgi:hypothetical protein
MKKIIFVSTLVLVAAAILFYFDKMDKLTSTNIVQENKKEVVIDTNNQRIANPELKSEEKVMLKQNPVTFSGKLEKVDVGCFSDGECYVEVAGKHVTVLMGWSRDTVGSVIGGDNSIGGLEGFIGKNIEIKANKIDEKNYTLYGDAGYYVKVK